MRTVLSCEADAIYERERMVGDQATSRTQSVWPVSVTVLRYVFCSGLNTSHKSQLGEPKHTPERDTNLQSQILTRQSLPPLTNLLIAPFSGFALTKLPGRALGAQLTLLTPSPCAFCRITWPQLPSWNSNTEMLPSEEAQASRQPHSWGAQLSRLTEAVWSVDSKTFWKVEAEFEEEVVGVERQIRTRPS